MPKFLTPLFTCYQTWLTHSNVVDHTSTLVPCSLTYNNLNEEGETSIRNAVQGKAGFQLQLLDVYANA